MPESKPKLFASDYERYLAFPDILTGEKKI